ncbi:MAG: cobyrinic acid a,c-diamide synthase [Nitrospinaceae bacterium]|nr:MAG: cobyrinic acid a,c-diamide synthase [Nitrospinaceae bacterium]
MTVPQQKIKGFIIAGTQSDIGKTSVSLGLMRLFARRGLAVAPFKVGPDYIDPGHHSRACGRPGYNLDSFMCTKPYVRRLFSEISTGSDVAIVEGVMGLFDGASPKSDKGSTAEIAKLLELPVILIFNGEATARSAAALVQGFTNFDPALKFLGVIANRVNHPGHANILKAAVEKYTSTRFLGHIPSDPELTLPSRHLGLLQSHENRESFYDRWADHLESHINIPGIQKFLRSSVKNSSFKTTTQTQRWPRRKAKSSCKVAVAKDEAFAFCYQDTLDVFAHHGVDICFFSPLKDKGLPGECDWVYLPGGYPELHLKKLSANKTMRRSLKSFGESGKVIVGECGGMMYLGKNIRDDKNQSHDMTGLFDFSTTMEPKKLTLGYRILKLQKKGHREKDLRLKGHEFHYSSFTKNRETPRLRETRAGNFSTIKDGYFYKNCFAFYSHIYWGSSTPWLQFILNRIQSARTAKSF